MFGINLSGDLELASFNDLTTQIGNVIDVNAAVIVIQVQRSLFCNVGILGHFLSKKIKNSDRKTFLITLLHVESDVRCSRVRIYL